MSEYTYDEEKKAVDSTPQVFAKNRSHTFGDYESAKEFQGTLPEDSDEFRSRIRLRNKKNVFEVVEYVKK